MRPFFIVGILVFGLVGACSALSFSSYAFLFPPVPHPLGLGSCVAFASPVSLTGKAAQESGFEQGVLHARASVQLQASARRLAQFQETALFWGGANAALYALSSVMCHRLAADALEEAVLAVNLNWDAVDRCIGRLEYAGVQLDGPAKGLHDAWQLERDLFENRTSGSGLGGRLVQAMRALSDAANRDEVFVEGVAALVGPDGVLDRQVSVCRDSERVLKQQESDAARLEDELDSRLQDGQRLGVLLETEKISLVPQYAFSLQSQAAYARTGWVQSFPEALQSAKQAGLDAQELRRKGQGRWKRAESGFAEQALTYFGNAREEAERAVVSWQAVDQKTQALESDLLRQVEQLRRDVQSERLRDAAGSLEDALTWQTALALSERPLPATRGERILQLADAVAALSDAKQNAKRPRDAKAVRYAVEEIKALLAAASADGLDVSFEKGALSRLDALGQGIADVKVAAELDGLRESVLQKARVRFSRLDALLDGLAPFRAYVALPSEVGPLVVESNLGQLAALEKQLLDARSRVQGGRMRWLADHLNARVVLDLGGEPVPVDEPARQSFRVTLSNGLDFGSDGPVLLARPDALPPGAVLVGDSDFRLLQDGFLLQRVDAGGTYAAAGVVDDVLVRTKSFTQETRYASVASVRRSWTVTLDSQISGTAQWLRPLDYQAKNAVLDGGLVAVDSGVVRVVLPHLKKGVSSFQLDFDVPNPVAVGKHSSASGWTYELESRVPFDVRFPLVLEEALACTPNSKELDVVSLSSGLYRFFANVTLHAFERKAYSVQLDCVNASLQNQADLLSRLPGMPAGTDRVLRQVQDLLSSGRFSEASWLLFQLQQPASVSDPLEKYRGLFSEDSARRLLERADAALQRGDSAVLDVTVKELDAYVKAQKSALEEQAKAVCGRCPPEVESGLHQVKSALFLGDLSDARARLSAAQAQYGAWVADEAEKNRTAHGLAAQIQAETWPTLVAFETAWAVPESALRWRTRQPLYSESSQRYGRLQSALKGLDAAGRKVLDGKEIVVSSVQADLDSAHNEHAALDALLDRLEADARASMQTAEKAFQQFGTPAQQLALDAVSLALDEGSFAAGWYAAEQLTAALAQRPSTASSPSVASGLLGSHSLLEVGAGLGGLLVLGALAYWFKKRQPDEPLEEIG